MPSPGQPVPDAEEGFQHGPEAQGYHISYNVIKRQVHLHDSRATVLPVRSIDHTRPT